MGSTTVSASNVISADSSVASSVSLDEDIEDSSPIKVKKKDEGQVIKKEAVSTSSKASPFGYENSTPSLVMLHINTTGEHRKLFISPQ
uniref:Homeotic protein proboscipedia-like n=1 Tax=Drosophila rhopaloa TaxID=1041015 RepID=A0A6P4FFQ7_DRORH